MSDNPLLGEKQENIFYITLNRPDKRNAIPFQLLADICRMVEDQMSDTQIRTIIIKGEGKVFSAGVDFNSLGSLVGPFTGAESAGGALIRSEIHKYQQYLNRLEVVEIPIICAIHGAVFGMALELALACDFRLMSEDCVWGMPELHFGLVADLGGTSRLHRTIGASRAMEVLMTGKRFAAQKALDWGLVSYLYPEDSLLDEAQKLARDISKMAPLAVGASKQIIKRGEGVGLMTQLQMETAQQSILARSDDFIEGISALMEKRDPQWKHK